MKTKASMPLSKIVLWTLILLVLVVPPAVQASQSWQAIAGAQSADMAAQAMAFLPNELWIYVNDSITWTFPTGGVHTVTFLGAGQTRPRFADHPLTAVGCPETTSSYDGSACVNSSQLLGGATYTITFPKAGNYKFLCLVHASMTGVVHVLGLSDTLPHNQGFYDDQATEEARALLSDTDHTNVDDRSDALSPGCKFGGCARNVVGNAVTAGIGEIVATAGGMQYLAIMRFLKGTIEVHVGDTVEWTNLDPAEPHTITFGTEPANPPVGPGPNPPSSNVTVDRDGARYATISSTDQSVHSGFIAPAPQERGPAGPAPGLLPVLGVTRFRVTFTVPGTFNYICAIHDELGMKGKVIVRP